MAGNVVVEDVDETEETPPELPAGWFLALGAAVVLVLVLLPGRPDDPATSTTVTIAETGMDADRWMVVDLPGSGRLRDVAQMANGTYAAVGDGPQVWRYDGETTWEWVLPPEATPGSLASVTPYAQGAVAVGQESPDGDLTRASIWKADGPGRWEPVDVESAIPSGLDGVVAVGQRLVAWGWQGSEQEFAPEAQPLLLHSPDGEDWTALDAFAGANDSARLLTVTNRLDTWYAAGYAIGRPALWTSNARLEEWTPIDTGDLPFGWGIVDVRWVEVPPDGTTRLVATLVNLSEGRSRRWYLADGAWTVLDERPQDPVVPVETGGETVGVGAGALWSGEGGEWQQLELSGEVVSAVGQAAVGIGPGEQPRAWVLDGAPEQGTAIPLGAGGRWEPVKQLPAVRAGAWQVAGGWVLAGDEQEWTFLGPEGEETFSPPWGEALPEIVPVGGEWVALPSMHWTSNGVDWEARSRPWGDDEAAGGVEAVAALEGRLIAVGRDERFLWNVAASRDGGRTWAPHDDPAPATPLWDLAATPQGFVAIAARTRGSEEVVTSRDGRHWEPLASARFLVEGNPPAVVTRDGRLVLLDTGAELVLPRADLTRVVRVGEGVLVVAGGSIWRRGEEWEQIPLDPPHGMGAARVELVPLGDRLLTVGSDRGRRVLYQWEPEP